MSEPMSNPMRRQLTSGRRITPAALLPWEPRPSTETSIPGHLCEVCLDAPAVAFVPAPWGGEMGVCTVCGGRPPAVPAARRDRHAAVMRHLAQTRDAIKALRERRTERP
jgi:hypothetical protein